MWILKKKVRKMEKRIADLARQIEGQQILIEILFEFSRSAANEKGMDLLSYQQLHSPSTDSSEKVRMLFQKIREFR